jgi:hypothetical protein
MIEDLTPITIAAVDGVCTGGGLELTLTCDFVVATDRSRWGMPEIDWDITPITLRRTKFALNKGADLPLSGAMAFEIPVQPFANKPGRFATEGIQDVAQPDTRAHRRRLSKSFWQH